MSADRHDARRGPTIVEQYSLPATSNREAQTVVKFADGTRVAVYASGKVKVGRNWTRLNKLDDEQVRVFNFGPGKAVNGSPASSFVHLNFEDREDHPALSDTGR